MRFNKGDKILCIRKAPNVSIAYSQASIGKVYTVHNPDIKKGRVQTIGHGSADWYYSDQFVKLENATPFMLALYA